MDDLEKKVGIVNQITETFPEPTKEVNKALTTIGKVINAALVTIKPFIWSFEMIGEWLDKKLPEKLQSVPPENIITPPINIAGPTIEAMRFTGENDILREMYANLLAKSMDKRTVSEVHPRFVEVIKNLTPLESKILNYFSNIENPYINKYTFQEYGVPSNWYYLSHKNVALTSIFDGVEDSDLNISIDNLCHLGIFIIKEGFIPGDIAGDELLKEFPHIDIKLKCKINVSRELRFVSTFTELSLTSFGKTFIRNVILPI